jgi:hypothetical protein
MTKVCDLCPLECALETGQIGLCRVRGNVDDKIALLTYGHVTTAIVGPVEQKPLYHYKPGLQLLSIGSAGCNMACAYCCPEGTLIRTPNGQVPIEKMKDGDEIIAVDDSHSFLRPVLAHVGHVFDRESEEVIELEVDGRTIQLTPEHPVLTKTRGWVEAGGLTEDDEVLCDRTYLM